MGVGSTLLVHRLCALCAFLCVIDRSLMLQARARETAVEYAAACRNHVNLENLKAACMEVKAQECAL